MSRRTDRNIGIIGLGIIGQRVADSLRRRGFHVFVWNRTPRPFPNFVGSPAEIAQLCDFVQIFVADDEALLQMVQQMKQALKGHHVVMAHCTVAPATMRAAAEIVQRRGARFLDAPFTGSRMAAEKGELVYYVAGDEAAFRRARPVLEASSKEIIEIGEIGQATTIKLATNMITAATAQVAAEALALVHASGVPIEKFAEAMRGNASSSGTLAMKLPKMIEGDFEPHFSVKHMLKDVQIVSRLSRSYGLFLSATEAARDGLMIEAREGRGDYDYSSVVHAFFPEGARPEDGGSAATEEQPTLAGLDDAPTEQPPAEVPVESGQTDGDILATAETPAEQPEELLSTAADVEPVATTNGATPWEVPPAAAVVAAEPVELGQVASVPEKRDAEPELREKTEAGGGPPPFSLVHLGIGSDKRNDEPEKREDEPAQGDDLPYQAAAEAQQSVAEVAPLEIAPENRGQEQREDQPEDRVADFGPGLAEVARREDEPDVPFSDLPPRDATPEPQPAEPPPLVAGPEQSVRELAQPGAEHGENQPEKFPFDPWPGLAEPAAQGEGMEAPSIDPAPHDLAPEQPQTGPVQPADKPELLETVPPPVATEPEQGVLEAAPPEIAPANREAKPEERAAAEPAKPKEPAQPAPQQRPGILPARDEKRSGLRRFFSFDY